MFHETINTHLLESFKGIQKVLKAFDKTEKSGKISQEKTIKLKSKDSMICYIIKLRSLLSLIGMLQYAFS